MTAVTPAVLSDGVVRLRPPQAADVAACTSACQDPDVQRWTLVPSPYGQADARQWIAAHSDPETWSAEPSWVITRVGEDAFLGNLAVRLDGEGGGDIGFLLAPQARGEGLAARSIRLACSWAFATLGLQVISWRAIAGNEASRRTAMAAGFRVVDTTLRRTGVQRGQRVDEWIGDLLPEDITPTGPRPRGARRGVVGAGPGLTSRERDVLAQLALGRSNRDAARALGISENTVKNHVRAVLEKLNAQSRSQAVVIALRNGLVTLPR